MNFGVHGRPGMVVSERYGAVPAFATGSGRRVYSGREQASVPHNHPRSRIGVRSIASGSSAKHTRRVDAQVADVPGVITHPRMRPNLIGVRARRVAYSRDLARNCSALASPIPHNFLHALTSRSLHQEPVTNDARLLPSRSHSAYFPENFYSSIPRVSH